MKKVFLGFLLLALSSATFIGCGEKEDIDLPDDIVSRYIGVAADNNPNLKILVSYLDTNPWTGYTGTKPIARLALIDENTLQSNPNYKFLGRAYAQDTPAEAFETPVNEFYTTLEPGYDIQGFQYVGLHQCLPGIQVSSPFPSDLENPRPVNVICPWGVSIKKRDPVFYSAISAYPSEGIIPLYQYSTFGGLGAGGKGNVSYTTNFMIIKQLRMSERVDSRIIGYIYHATSYDCSLKRSIFCGR